jgi:hypothetical protein
MVTLVVLYTLGLAAEKKNQEWCVEQKFFSKDNTLTVFVLLLSHFWLGWRKSWLARGLPTAQLQKLCTDRREAEFWGLRVWGWRRLP